MAVRPARLLGAILASCALTMTPLLSVPSSAATAPLDAGRAVAQPQARTGHSGSYRITVRGWTRTIVRGNQATINRCHATLWEGPLPGAGGTTWLAGHDYCGF